MHAPRNARSSSMRSTGMIESRRMYSCMATRTARRASELGEGVLGASVIGPQDYTKQALSPTTLAPYSTCVAREIESEKAVSMTSVIEICAPWRRGYESHLHHKLEAGFPGEKGGCRRRPG